MAVFEGPIESPVVNDIVITIGADFKATVQLFEDDEVTPLDFTGWSAFGEARHQEKDSSTLLFTFNVASFDFPNASFPYTVSRSVTKDLDPTLKKAYYSIFFIDPSDFAQVYIEGKISFNIQPTDLANKP